MEIMQKYFSKAKDGNVLKVFIEDDDIAGFEIIGGNILFKFNGLSLKIYSMSRNNLNELTPKGYKVFKKPIIDDFKNNFDFVDKKIYDYVIKNSEKDKLIDKLKEEFRDK